MPAIESQLAPTVLLVRYLAVFQRLFTAVIDYTHKDDKPGMLLGGWLADALHNVPAMLLHCDPQAWDNPTDTEARLQEFPQRLRPKAAPERLVEDSRRILSPVGVAQELQLRDDMTDVNLAPLPKMHEYLNRLYDACLCMRAMRGYGSRPSPVRQAIENALDGYHLVITGECYSGGTYTPWQGLEQAWAKQAEEAEAQATFNEVIASVLLPVPKALVQWDRFDEEQFHNNALYAAERLPNAGREAWVSYHNKFM